MSTLISTDKWIPLENDPEVLNKYLARISNSSFRLCDVVSFENDAAQFISGRLIGIIVLYPTVIDLDEETGKEVKDVIFIKQMVHNACATMALVHGLINFDGPKGGLVDELKVAITDLDPEKAGEMLVNIFKKAHNEFSMGALGNPASEHDMATDLHFVTFIVKGSRLYQLDGRKAGPIDKGPSSESDLLSDAIKVIKRDFLSKLAPNECRFSCLALVKE
ncbi:hypothetical protein ACOME3_007972 [Neoechinorhynchus agilis]